MQCITAMYNFERKEVEFYSIQRILEFYGISVWIVEGPDVFMISDYVKRSFQTFLHIISCFRRTFKIEKVKFAKNKTLGV